MDDNVILPIMATLFSVWVGMIVLEVCFKVWHWNKHRESIGDRWIRQDLEERK